MVRTLTLISMLLMSFFTYAEGSGDGASGGVQYVHLQPAFVVNYGDNATGRLKYIRTDIALRVLGPEAAGKVNHHQAYVRNQLVLLLSQQTEQVQELGEANAVSIEEVSSTASTVNESAQQATQLLQKFKLSV